MPLATFVGLHPEMVTCVHGPSWLLPSSPSPPTLRTSAHAAVDKIGTQHQPGILIFERLYVLVVAMLLMSFFCAQKPPNTDFELFATFALVVMTRLPSFWKGLR